MGVKMNPRNNYVIKGFIFYIYNYRNLVFKFNLCRNLHIIVFFSVERYEYLTIIIGTYYLLYKF